MTIRRIFLTAFAILSLSLILYATRKTQQIGPKTMKTQIIDTYPHDPQAFTQGLVLYDGYLYESTGLYGKSTLRKTEKNTGKVIKRIELPVSLFGEGLARVDGRLIQLTYREQVANRYDLQTFEKTDEFSYRGEGWGLCFDTNKLVMSNGTNILTFRDPEKLNETGTIRVMLRGKGLERINELECVDGSIYANVLNSETIVRIDPTTGYVTEVIDASGLLTAEERIRSGDLNGIAYDPTAKTFLLTGKLWPKLFEVRFVAK